MIILMRHGVAVPIPDAFDQNDGAAIEAYAEAQALEQLTAPAADAAPAPAPAPDASAETALPAEG